MDEVDRIIISTLSELGCSVEGVSSLSDFTVALVIEGTVRCLTAINPDFNCSMVLPSQLAKQFRVGQQLADSCVSLGYRGEIGYQTFLYANLIEWRRVFVFLIESLPKAAREGGDSSVSGQALLQRRITKSFQLCAAEFDCPSVRFVPVHSDAQMKFHRSNGIHRSVPLTLPDSKSKSYFIQHLLPTLNCQQYCPGALHWNPWPASCLDLMSSRRAAQLETEYLQLHQSEKHGHETQMRRKEIFSQKLAEGLRHGMMANKHFDNQSNDLSTSLSDILCSFQPGGPRRDQESIFQATEKFHFSQLKPLAPSSPQLSDNPSRSLEDSKKQREERREELTEQLAQIAQKIASLELEISRVKMSIGPTREQVLQQQQRNADMKELIRSKKRVLELAGGSYEEGVENADKLDEVIQAMLARIQQSAETWEKQRQELYEELRRLSDTMSSSQIEMEKETRKMHELKELMRECAAESQLKDSTLLQLKEEYENVNKDAQRTSYTKRIMEILANIQKQKKEIERVLVDMRQLQKEINQLEGKVGRIFSLADEKIFKAAKKDESLRNLYKKIVALHSTFGNIIQTIEQIGSIERYTKDLEDQIEDEKAKEVGSNLKSMQKDYQLLVQENEEMQKKLTAK